ncbi:hypothetical protein HAX54_003241 [Datura stramonium]|uniref:Uncharacterized protein n=1 Tax=Datura stramonium TaxID=4076 RepID=A0ABS8T6J9_DATST|nr:hypothetical protein [Datura stramonium]
MESIVLSLLWTGFHKAPLGSSYYYKIIKGLVKSKVLMGCKIISKGWPIYWLFAYTSGKTISVSFNYLLTSHALEAPQQGSQLGAYICSRMLNTIHVISYLTCNYFNIIPHFLW